MLAEVAAESLVHERFNDSLHFAVAELRLRLPFELRFGNLNADHRGQAFANIFTLKIFFVFFKQAAVKSVIIDRPGQRGTKSDEVRAAFGRVDIVGESENILDIAVVPLQGDFHADAIFLAFKINDLWVDRSLGAVEMLNKGQETAFVEKLVLFLRTFVFNDDLDAAIQKRQLA